MEFVRGLPASVDTMEFAVDGPGRAECFQGRVRLTYYRVASGEDGAALILPAVCLVWSMEALRLARPQFMTFWAKIEDRGRAGDFAAMAPLVAGMH